MCPHCEQESCSGSSSTVGCGDAVPGGQAAGRSRLRWMRPLLLLLAHRQAGTSGALLTGCQRHTARGSHTGRNHTAPNSCLSPCKANHLARRMGWRDGRQR